MLAFIGLIFLRTHRSKNGELPLSSVRPLAKAGAQRERFWGLIPIRQLNMFTRRSREGGNPVAFVRTTLDPRFRGDDGITVFICRINRNPQYSYRNIHALLQPKMPQKPRGICGKHYLKRHRICSTRVRITPKPLPLMPDAERPVEIRLKERLGIAQVRNKGKQISHTHIDASLEQ
jgi:hypothetical protein